MGGGGVIAMNGLQYLRSWLSRISISTSWPPTTSSAATASSSA